MRRPWLAVPVLLLATGVASAADDDGGYWLLNPTPDASLRDMDTDRPNHVNTPNTIDAGHLQVETGLADLTRDWDHDSSTGFATGEFNARLGLLPAVEVNAAITSWETGPGGSGVGDLDLGGKFTLWRTSSDAAWTSGFAIQPQIKLPTAGDRRGNGHVEMLVNTPYLLNLPNGWHFGAQLSPALLRNEANTALVGGLQESVSIDRVLIGQADVYLEYWSQQTVTGTHPQQTIDTGFTLPIGKNVVLDDGVFFGLGRASPSFEYVAGISTRF